MAASAPLVTRMLTIALAGAALGSNTPPLTNQPPYKPSARIAAIEMDFTRLQYAALGSDNFALTWAADDHQYTVWGDGGGFGGADWDGRASLGVARVEGDAGDFRAVNVWGGKDAENPATFEGKSYGILSVGGTLYMWTGPGSGVETYAEARLASSTDFGATWRRADWAFESDARLSHPTFLQFGRDYAGARDDFVYAYFVRQRIGGHSLVIQRPGAIDLGRVPRERILDRNAWEFYAGKRGGKPAWSASVHRRRAVFRDPNGVGWCASAAFLPGADRIVLCTEHTQSFRGNMGLFEAEAPWGPWRTVLYEKAWGSPHVPAKSFFWNFAPKWSQGLDVVLVFTGIEEVDAWVSVPGRLVLREG